MIVVPLRMFRDSNLGYWHCVYRFDGAPKKQHWVFSLQTKDQAEAQRRFTLRVLDFMDEFEGRWRRAGWPIIDAIHL